MTPTQRQTAIHSFIGAHAYIQSHNMILALLSTWLQLIVHKLRQYSLRNKQSLKYPHKIFMTFYFVMYWYMCTYTSARLSSLCVRVQFSIVCLFSSHFVLLLFLSLFLFSPYAFFSRHPIRVRMSAILLLPFLQSRLEPITYHDGRLLSVTRCFKSLLCYFWMCADECMHVNVSMCVCPRIHAALRDVSQLYDDTNKEPK